MNQGGCIFLFVHSSRSTACQQNGYGDTCLCCSPVPTGIWPCNMLFTSCGGFSLVPLKQKLHAARGWCSGLLPLFPINRLVIGKTATTKKVTVEHRTPPPVPPKAEQTPQPASIVPKCPRLPGGHCEGMGFPSGQEGQCRSILCSH